MKWLADRLRAPELEHVDVDGADRLRVHAMMLKKKPMIQAVFSDFHKLFEKLDKKLLAGSGSRIEIGAGVAPMRDSFADVLATDIVPGPTVDMVLDAENMDVPDQTVRLIVGQNCFHHLPHPRKFFSEMERVLEPGGGVILLEPYYGPVASFLFRNLFHSEGYDKGFPHWETPSTGPMNGANQALSYIVFVRDRAEFEKEFPNLQIVHQEVCNNYLMYLMSGGLNFRQIWPNQALPVLKLIQKILSPFNRWLGLHHVVVIRKAG